MVQPPFLATRRHAGGQRLPRCLGFEDLDWRPAAPTPSSFTPPHVTSRRATSHVSQLSTPNTLPIGHANGFLLTNLRCANTYFPLAGDEGSRLVDMIVPIPNKMGDVPVVNHDHEKLLEKPREGRWAVTLNEVWHDMAWHGLVWYGIVHWP